MLQKSPYWLLVWVLATVISWTVVGLFAFGLIAYADASSVAGLLLIIPLLVVLLLFAAVVTGGAQALLLPRAWQITRRWIGMTVVGIFASLGTILLVLILVYVFFISWTALFGLAENRRALSDASDVLTGFAILIAITGAWCALGTTVAFFQKRALKGHVDNPKAWVQTTFIAWFLGLFVVVVVTWLLDLWIGPAPRTIRVSTNAMPWILVAYPVFVGVITGMTMRRWIEPKSVLPA